jgi:hypothetical protein
MKIEQFPYCSPKAMEARRRDGVPPWGAHPCECDSLGEPDPTDRSPFAESLREAWRLRRELEGAD